MYTRANRSLLRYSFILILYSHYESSYYENFTILSTSGFNAKTKKEKLRMKCAYVLRLVIYFSGFLWLKIRKQLSLYLCLPRFCFVDCVEFSPASVCFYLSICAEFTPDLYGFISWFVSTSLVLCICILVFMDLCPGLCQLLSYTVSTAYTLSGDLSTCLGQFLSASMWICLLVCIDFPSALCQILSSALSTSVQLSVIYFLVSIFISPGQYLHLSLPVLTSLQIWVDSLRGFISWFVTISLQLCVDLPSGLGRFLFCSMCRSSFRSGLISILLYV